MHLRRLPALSLALLLFAATLASTQAPKPPAEQVWRFDNLNSIGGHPTQILGHPQVIESPYGKAVQFNGVDDALFLPVHPLAGASTYTWEVIFRPDAGGAQAQRFFHLQEQDPATGQDTKNRMLFEIRIVDGKWCLDSFASSGENNRTLLNCQADYDGKELRNYIGDVLQGSGPLDLKPQFPGHTSVGIRINKLFPFKGAVLLSRMVPRALPMSEFLQMPPGTAGNRE